MTNNNDPISNQELLAENTSLKLQVSHLTKLISTIANESEQENECVSLRLLKKLETLTKEKTFIAQEFEVEEEHIVNSLLKRMKNAEAGYKNHFELCQNMYREVCAAAGMKPEESNLPAPAFDF